MGCGPRYPEAFRGAFEGVAERDALAQHARGTEDVSVSKIDNRVATKPPYSGNGGGDRRLLGKGIFEVKGMVTENAR